MLKNLIWVIPPPPPSFHSVKGGRSTSDRADPDGSRAHRQQVQRVEGGQPAPGAGDLCEAQPAGGSRGAGGGGGLQRCSCGGDQFMSRGLEDSPHWLWTQTLTAPSTSAELWCFNPLDHRVFFTPKWSRSKCDWSVILKCLFTSITFAVWVVWLGCFCRCWTCAHTVLYFKTMEDSEPVDPLARAQKGPFLTVRFIFLFPRGEQISACYWCHASNVRWHMYSNCFIVCLSPDGTPWRIKCWSQYWFCWLNWIFFLFTY